MITRLSPLAPLTISFLAITIIITTISPSAAARNGEGFKGASYEAKNGHYIDFRDVTTLGEFDRIVTEDRWNGIEARDVLSEFSKFQGISGSPALREVWRNVLLGDFSGLNISGAQEQSQLMAERIRILNRLGFFDEAVRLYQQAAEKKPIPEIVAKQGVEAFAMTGSADGACLEVIMASKFLGGKEWSQDAAMCAAYFGEKERAKAIYNDVAKISADGFRSVFKTVMAGSGGSIQPSMPALWRTILLAQGASIPQSTLSQSDAMTLASLAVNKNVPFGTRMAAASRGADRGTIGAERLRKLYETNSDAATPGSSQSALYSQARFTFEGNQRAGVVRQAMRQLRPATNIKGHVFMWIVDKLTLQVNRLDWFAPYGFALMMATGRYESADMYYEVGKLDKSPFAIIHAIQHGKPWTKQKQTEWVAAMKRAGKTTQIDKSFKLVKAFDQEDKLALAKSAIIKTDATKPISFMQDSVRKGGRGLSLITAINYLAKAKELSAVKADETAEIIRVLTNEGQFIERKKIALEIFLQTVL